MGRSHMVILDALPKTMSGKIRKNVLRDELSAEHPGAENPSGVDA